VELAWWTPVGVPAFLMITALALQELEHALLGPHDQSDALRPQSVVPGISTPTQQCPSPVTGAFPPVPPPPLRLGRPQAPDQS
jgi:hypothetical protein